jgi:hypothetical protein
LLTSTLRLHLRGTFVNDQGEDCGENVLCKQRRLKRDSLTDLWKATPISVRKTSKFLPPKLCCAASRTFSRVSQHITHGSVLTRANDRSSFRGLKSFFFCFASCVDSQETTALARITSSANHPQVKTQSATNSQPRVVKGYWHRLRPD